MTPNQRGHYRQWQRRLGMWAERHQQRGWCPPRMPYVLRRFFHRSGFARAVHYTRRQPATKPAITIDEATRRTLQAQSQFLNRWMQSTLKSRQGGKRGERHALHRH